MSTVSIWADVECADVQGRTFTAAFPVFRRQSTLAVALLAVFVKRPSRGTVTGACYLSDSTECRRHYASSEGVRRTISTADVSVGARPRTRGMGVWETPNEQECKNMAKHDASRSSVSRTCRFQADKNIEFGRTVLRGAK